ncbi:MAG TPA: glycoside hydrolase family 36 protein, partial [Dehalococcoidia bacterium]|nr:glycoside hydrolase family 36 protein [Dehalococcoidia bacterium]
MTSFSAGQLSLAIDAQSLTLESPAGSWLGVTATVVTSDARGVVAGLEVISQEDSEEGLEVRLTGSCDYGQLRLRIGVSAVEPVAIVWLDLLTNRSLDLHSVTLTGVVSGQFDRFWKQGWQSWSPAYVAPLAGADESLPDRVLRGFGDFTEGLTSFDVGLLAGSQGALCAGFLTADRFPGSLNVLDGSLACSWLAASAAVEQDELLSFEPLRIELSSDPQRALERYAAAVAEVASTDLPEAVPSGWCSWYYYYTAVTEADVLANLRFLAGHRRELPIQFVQLDDGYQADIGDWIDWNEKFPGGPRRLTEEIHKAGLKAGIWLAPFLAGEDSKLATQHPDWLVRDSAGTPVVAVTNWDQANYALDLTHPAVREWLRDLFIEIFDDWNFDYVKIDFVFAGALPGRRH